MTPTTVNNARIKGRNMSSQLLSSSSLSGNSFSRLVFGVWSEREVVAKVKVATDVPAWLVASTFTSYFVPGSRLSIVYDRVNPCKKCASNQRSTDAD